MLETIQKKNPVNSKTLLVVRWSSLGDIVLIQPVLAQAAREGWSVDVWVRPGYHGLAELLPGAQRVISDPAALRKHYDVVLDLHATGKVRQQLRKLSATRMMHYHKHSLARRLLVRPWGLPMFWNTWSGLRTPQQVRLWYSEAGVAVGLQPAQGWPEVQVSPSAREAARVLLSQTGISDSAQIALLAPGAKWATKRWPLEFFCETAGRLLREHGLRPIFIGGPEDQALCDQASSQVGAEAVSVAGRTAFSTLAALFQMAAVAITNDSGPLHLGLAAGCPVVALFGPTVAEFGFMPLQHPRAVILSQSLACKPCSLHGSRKCPQGHHNCMRLLMPGAVLEAVGRMIKK